MSLISFKLKSVLLDSERERERERERTRLQKDTYFIFFSIQKNNSFEKKNLGHCWFRFFFRRDDFRISRQKSKPSWKCCQSNFFSFQFSRRWEMLQSFNCFANCLAFFTIAYPHQHCKVSYHVIASFYKLGACPIKLWLGRTIFAKFCSVIFKVFVTSNNLIELIYVLLS